MQKFSAIFFAILLSINVVSSLRLNPIDASMLPSHSIRARLTQMMVQVQQTDSPKTIKAFLSEITGMMKKLQEEQAKHQEISDKMMAQCKDEEEFRTKAVAEAQEALNKSNEARNKCQVSLDESNKDLPELQSALETYETQLHNAEVQRKKEHEVYLKKKADYEEAISFLEDFIAYCKSKLTDFTAFKTTSFVEQSEKLLRHATRLGLLQHAVPVLVTLASRQDGIPTTHNNYNYVANQDIGNKLNEALNTLLKKIQSDWKDNEETEVKAQTAFNTLKAKLESAISTLQDNITRTKEQITSMTKCVKDEEAIEALANEKLTRNAGLKDSAKKMCDNFAGEFIKATEARMEEIKTVNEILGIVEKRFGTLPEDFKTYLKSIENGFTAYVNSTEFHKFVAYQEKHIADDARGKKLVSAKNLIK